jgi:hypothetical protein
MRGADQFAPGSRGISVNSESRSDYQHLLEWKDGEYMWQKGKGLLEAERERDGERCS